MVDVYLLGCLFVRVMFIRLVRSRNRAAVRPVPFPLEAKEGGVGAVQSTGFFWC